MSIKCMNYVWTQSIALGTTRLMLLAIADSCNDDGEWSPGVARLALKCGIGERQAQRLLRELESLGELEILYNHGVKTAYGFTNHYRMKRFQESNGVTSMTPPSIYVNGGRGDIYDTPRGDIYDTPRVTSMTPNTSVDTSDNTSVVKRNSEEAHSVRSQSGRYAPDCAEPGKPTEGKANPSSVKGRKVSKTNGFPENEQETSLNSPNNNSLCEQEPALSKPKKEAHPMTKPILDAYVEVRGKNGINYGKESKFAKKIAEQEGTPELVKECYAWLKAQEFWRYKPLGLATIYENLPEYIAFKSGKVQALPVQATMLDYAFDEGE